jgi:hypothetical protein
MSTLFSVNSKIVAGSFYTGRDERAGAREKSDARPDVSRVADWQQTF